MGQEIDGDGLCTCILPLMCSDSAGMTVGGAAVMLYMTIREGQVLIDQISTQAPNPHRRASSFEPVALLLGIPLLYRLFPRHYLPHWVEDDAAQSASASTSASFPSKPISKALDPSLDPDIDIDTTTATPATAHNPPVSLRATETLLLTAAHGCSGEGQGYDTPNTYLTPEAVDLPERQCTLCLEPRGTGEGSGGTVGVTECGHIFCWGCLGGLEKVSPPAILSQVWSTAWPLDGSRGKGCMIRGVMFSWYTRLTNVAGMPAVSAKSTDGAAHCCLQLIVHETKTKVHMRPCFGLIVAHPGPGPVYRSRGTRRWPGVYVVPRECVCACAPEWTSSSP